MFTAIVGKKGTGKSFFAKNKIKEYLERFKTKNRLIIFDVNGEYEYLSQYAPVSDYNAFIFALKNKQFPIIYNPRRVKDDLELIYDVLCEYPEYLLVIDEFHFFANRFMKSSNLIELVRRQRHLPADLIGITQRVGDISPDVLSQVDYLITFKQTLPRDLKILADYGIKPADFEKLPQYGYISLEL